MPVTFFPSPSSGGGTDPLSLLASQPEAEAGTESAKLMSPVRTAEAIAALGGGIPTGVMLHYAGDTAPAGGWLKCDGSTIGDAASGAGFAHADAYDLFMFLWELDSSLTVAPIRGTSAQNDWDLSRTITLPNSIGRVLVALDGDAFESLGYHTGETAHQLIADELPVIGDHTHVAPVNSSIEVSGGGGTFVPMAGYNDLTQPGGGFGADTPHNNIQPSLTVGCVIIKI